MKKQTKTVLMISLVLLVSIATYVYMNQAQKEGLTATYYDAQGNKISDSTLSLVNGVTKVSYASFTLSVTNNDTVPITFTLSSACSAGNACPPKVDLYALLVNPAPQTVQPGMTAKWTSNKMNVEYANLQPYFTPTLPNDFLIFVNVRGEAPGKARKDYLAIGFLTVRPDSLDTVSFTSSISTSSISSSNS